MCLQNSKKHVGRMAGEGFEDLNDEVPKAKPSSSGRRIVMTEEVRQTSKEKARISTTMEKGHQSEDFRSSRHTGGRRRKI